MASIRNHDRTSKFRATRPDYAQMGWLLDAAPATSGFGLGRVPWCGAQAHIGVAPCTDNSGVPKQMPSDFAYLGVASVFGLPAAMAIVVALLGWCAALTRSAQQSIAQAAHPHPWAYLQLWIVVLTATAAQAQLITTLAGAMGWLPLSGVNLPLLSYGAFALCVTAFWVGLALNPVQGNSSR